MKRLALPLIAALPFLTALVPHADAGAITADSSILSPSLIRPGAFRKARNGSVPIGAIKLPRLASASNEIVPTVLGNGSSGGTGGTLSTGSFNLFGGSLTAGAWTNGPRTGAGTLNVTGPNFLGGEALQLLTIGIGSVNSIDTNGATINLDTNGATINLGSGALTKAGAGTLTIEGSLGVYGMGGTLNFEVSQTLDALVIDGGGTIQLSSLSAPPAPGAGTAGGAPAPVPEPGIGVLFAIGMLAASRARLRRAT